METLGVGNCGEAGWTGWLWWCEVGWVGWVDALEAWRGGCGRGVVGYGRGRNPSPRVKCSIVFVPLCEQSKIYCGLSSRLHYVAEQKQTLV